MNCELSKYALDKMDFKKRIPVEIEWLDAQTWSGSAEEFEEIIKWKPIVSYSCGYLVHEDNEKVIISFLNFGDELTKHFQMIPVKMIKKIIKLKEYKNGRTKDFRKSVGRNRTNKKTKRK